MSVAAYQRARTIVESPRSTEHRLFAKITSELIFARDGGQVGVALMPALQHNRELWSVLANDCALPGNSLPSELRASIISLALWVDRHTSAVVVGRESIDDLIDINRMIMEGLG